MEFAGHKTGNILMVVQLMNINNINSFFPNDILATGQVSR